VIVLEVTIRLEYDDVNMARAVARAVSPDNFKTPKGLLVETVWTERQVLTRVKSKGKLATFIATIDDLLFSTATAEKTLRTIERK
jgi:hypothetical protein